MARPKGRWCWPLSQVIYLLGNIYLLDDTFARNIFARIESERKEMVKQMVLASVPGDIFARKYIIAR